MTPMTRMTCGCLSESDHAALAALHENLARVSRTKRVFDVALALVLLVLLSPLFLLIALLILLRDGDRVFLVEPRVSQGASFPFVKFRIFTLPAAWAITREGASAKSLEQDPANLTCVGAVLKRYGLDELPQLWNILRGDMSFVGPRPAPMGEYLGEIERGITRKQTLKAGLTAGAQLLKGTRRTFEDEVALDNAYIAKCRVASPIWIMLEDVRILVRLVGVALKGTGE